MVSISGDLPILRFLEELHAFSKNLVSISGDLPIFSFIEKLHAFFEKWS